MPICAMMKTVQITIDEALLNDVDRAADKAGATRLRPASSMAGRASSTGVRREAGRGALSNTIC